MYEKLLELQKRSYAPYSFYKVSAILVTNDNREFIGVNVENASYGGSICAERNALNNAISNGYTKGDFKKLYVMTDGDKISYPCSICIQSFVEFFDNNMNIVCFNKKGESDTVTLNDLCPYAFNADDLV